MHVSEASMRWDIPNNGSSEAFTDEDGSSLWGCDSEDSEDDSISHSLTGAQHPSMLGGMSVKLFQYVCTSNPHPCILLFHR